MEISTLTRESGATVVYITHDQAEAFALADEVGVLEGGQLVQLGSPEDVYHRPASPFVARFTGLAGELEGVLEPRPDHAATASGTVLVRTAAGTVAAVPGGGTRATGGPVRVMVRPAAVTLAPGAGPAGRTLSGTVVDTAYRGRGYDHVVELPGGVRLTSVFDRSPHPRGTAVQLLLDPDGCFAFPDHGPTAEPPAVPAAEPTSAAGAVAADAAEPAHIRTTLEVR